MIGLNKNCYQWAIIGAGPAGLASAGLLLDQGVNPLEILLIDPDFKVGDFGKYWGEVYSNTSIEFFLKFLTEIKGFSFNSKATTFPLELKAANDYCQLKEVSKALSWVSNHLQQTISTTTGYVDSLQVKNGAWHINLGTLNYSAHKVILATGSDPKSMSHDNIEEISLYTALDPKKLKNEVTYNDCVAVFGSSHSSMIIMKNLLDAGITSIVNFYLAPHRYALKIGESTLYDNTGLKAHTAEWVRNNISKHLDSRISRYLSTQDNIKKFIPICNKGIYPIGFQKGLHISKESMLINMIHVLALYLRAYLAQELPFLNLKKGPWVNKS